MVVRTGGPCPALIGCHVGFREISLLGQDIMNIHSLGTSLLQIQAHTAHCMSSQSIERQLLGQEQPLYLESQ